MRRGALIAAALVALALVVGANYVLLGYGASRDERLGKLSPRGFAPAVTTPAPAPAGGEAERADD